MAEYLVLARKYRSTTFDEVVGQEAISTTLVNAIKTGRVAHAYLFTGTRGVGKTSMARILGKALNCLSSEEPTVTPCGECDACISIARGDDMDVIEIDGASNRGIDEIRELRDNAILRPARSRYKIYYIDEVHMLTKEAFNALLKTLEEPPGHVKFIFATTQAEKVPATILSRCQRFDFRNIPTDSIDKHLASICKAEKIKISDEALFRVSKAAAGSMRDGISLLDQLISSAEGKLTEQHVLNVLGTPPDERVDAMLTAIADGDPAEALEQLDAVVAAGFPLELLVTALADQFRNIMLALTCGADSRLIELPESRRGSLTELSKRFTLPAAVHAIGVTEHVGRALRFSSSARALAEAGIVRLAAADKFVDADSLIERLESLSGQASAPGGATRHVTGQKKKPLTVPARQTDTPDPQIQWTLGWLSANWASLVNRLAKDSPGVAGVLRPAKPIAAELGRLRLGFDNQYEPIRRRAAGQMATKIAESLSTLAGRRVECELVSTGEGERAADPRKAARVSTADNQAVHDDPAVKTLLELFGGQVDQLVPDSVIAAADDAPSGRDQSEITPDYDGLEDDSQD